VIEGDGDIVQRKWKIVEIWWWRWSTLMFKRKESKPKRNTYLFPIDDQPGILACLPWSGGNQRINHKINSVPIHITSSRLLQASMKWYKHMEESIVMSYRWHSLREGNTDAIWLTWIIIKTKRGRVERRRRKQKQRRTWKSYLFITYRNNERKEEVTSVSLLI